MLILYFKIKQNYIIVKNVFKAVFVYNSNAKYEFKNQLYLFKCNKISI